MRLRPAKGNQSANPKGLPMGSRYRLSEKFLADLSQQWDEFGKAALLETARTDPAPIAGSWRRSCQSSPKRSKTR
jgi:hypothetical protein